MTLAGNSNFIPIIIIIAAITLVLLVGVIIFYRLVIFPRKLKKQISDLNRKHEYFTSLLSNQCQMNVKKIEKISNSNLLYVELAQKESRKLKDIKIKYVSASTIALREIKDLCIEKKYGVAKSKLEETRTIVETTEAEINKFNEELLSLIKPQEDSKQLIANCRDRYRRIKIRKTELEEELSLVNHSFEKIFQKMDAMFVRYDEAIDRVNIEECQNLAPTLEEMSKELENAILVLPDMCHAVNETIPEELRNLSRSYNQMVDEQYNLSEFNVKAFLSQAENELVAIKKDMTLFKLSDVQNRIDAILNHISYLLKAFEDEKNIKIVFENEVGEVYEKVSELEKKFIKLSNTIPEIKKIYILDEEELNRIKILEANVTKVGNLKRTLDTYIQPFSMQPFTVKANKMNELKLEEEKVDKDILEFLSYIESVKANMQEAHNSIITYFNKAKKAENILNEISIEVFSNKYTDKIKRIYALVDELNKLLNILPIDVLRVNVAQEELLSLDNDVLKKLEQEYNEYVLAEDAIVFTNRYRGHLASVDDILNQAESYFYNLADFKKAYETAVSAEKLVNEQTNKESKK